MIYSFAKFYIYFRSCHLQPHIHRFMTELVCNFLLFFEFYRQREKEKKWRRKMMTFEWVGTESTVITVNIVKLQWGNNNKTGTDGKEKFDAWHKTSPMGLISFSSYSLLLPLFFIFHVLRVVTSKWSLIYVQQPLVIFSLCC